MTLQRAEDQTLSFDLERDAVDFAYREKTALLESLNLRRRLREDEVMGPEELARVSDFESMVNDTARRRCICSGCVRWRKWKWAA